MSSIRASSRRGLCESCTLGLRSRAAGGPGKLLAAQLLQLQLGFVGRLARVVAQGLVGLLDLVKLILFLRLQGRVGDLVRMAGKHKLAICLLDGGSVGALLQTQGSPVVG